MMEESTSAEVKERDGVYLLDLDYRLVPAVDLVLNHVAREHEWARRAQAASMSRRSRMPAASTTDRCVVP